jgi:NADH-quinone oxidoreductase subunit N
MSDLWQLSPIFLVAITGLAILILDLFRDHGEGGGLHLSWFTAIGLGAALGAVWNLWPGSTAGLESAVLAGSMVIDGYTLFFWALLIVATIVAALYSNGFDRENNLDHGEYYSFLSFALVGMMFMVAASDLLLLFFALETMSMAIYVLVGMKRDSKRASEAALKYFFNGALASSMLLYGMALLWGETGTLDLASIGSVYAAGNVGPLLYIAAGMVLVGFGFKVAAVPFHMWTPDAYQGAPTPVGGFMASAVKAAAFAALLRIVFQAMLPESFAQLPFSYADMIIFIAVLTMTVGNLLAIHQDDVKRMLSYSSISHAGYLLMGLVLVPPLGSGHPGLRFVNETVLFYLAAYGFSTLLAFGVLARLGQGGSEDTTQQRLAGLARRRPGLALLLAVALFSLAGFPPTAGFFAKFSLFREIMVLSNGKLTILLVIAVINALFSVYYYIRPIIYMYMKDAEGEAPEEIVSSSSSFALVVLALLIVFLGLFPGRLADLSRTAARDVVYKHAPNLRSSGPAALAPFAAKDAPRE